ncbi:MAG: sensor histidine kinase [Thermonemataceae bacterium]
MDTLQTLQQNPAFSNVPADQLQWLIDQASIRDLEEGAHLFSAEKPIEGMVVLLAGRIDINRTQAGQRYKLDTLTKHSISGILPYSRLEIAKADGVVKKPVKVLVLPKERLPDLARTNYELTEVLVHQMTSRVREFTKQQQMNEKLMSLGKLSAGLAHELNNPASAVVRSSTALKEHLTNTPDRFKKVMAIKVTTKEVDFVNDLMFEKISQAASVTLTLMQKTSLEDELLDWLEERDVTNAFDIAPIFVEFGFKEEDLEKIEEAVTLAHADAVINWVANNLITEKIVMEIEEASKRIAHLINSIKSYSHMDRATDKAQVNIKEGISNTLTLLGHKFKRKNIQVNTHIPEDTPTINAFGGELNQVWTNLIVNAIDAIGQDGEIQIKALQEPEYVTIEIIDNGKGIPEDVIDQIFDPFFTTKAVGEGTGLGLDIVQRIVRNHRGKITVASQPGETVFSVCLPIQTELS